MPRVLVIADDLTGAAEIAGLATRSGLDTQLLRKPAPPPTACDCVVYDTDTRLLPRSDAVRVTRTFAEAARAGAFDWVFKKTDSVLRGEPLAEIEAVADVFRRDRVLFIPHNPSRGRCVVGGRYLINGIEIDRTEFAADPLHSATTSDVIGLLRSTHPRHVRSVPRGDAWGEGVAVAEAASVSDVAAWAEQFDPRALAAGGADWFEALCRRFVAKRPVLQTPAMLPRPLLIVSGTASKATASFRDDWARDGLVLPMPDDVFADTTDGRAWLRWSAAVLPKLHSAGRAMMTIGRPSDTAPGRAQALGVALVQSAARAVQIGQVRTVACEGGATAAAWCDALGWDRFWVDGEFATGVVSVRLRPDSTGPRFVLKPGSYAWPALDG